MNSICDLSSKTRIYQTSGCLTNSSFAICKQAGKVFSSLVTAPLKENGAKSICANAHKFMQ